ncbi:hypothetical protein M426DRAFT_319194 [Hypoxylon sp. CI-4A]|nr:hypothetical protein M426DRAFT_319194 [Hypoxylon sp. CI-4A]
MRPFTLGALARALGSQRATASSSTLKSINATRTFSSLPSLRPTIFGSSGTAFRSPNTSNGLLNSYTPTSDASGAIAADLVPKTAITSHPALIGCAAQVRFGPRPTMARTSRLVRKRRHGFLSRVQSRNGRKTLQRRREKKRSILSN